MAVVRLSLAFSPTTSGEGGVRLRMKEPIPGGWSWAVNGRVAKPPRQPLRSPGQRYGRYGRYNAAIPRCCDDLRFLQISPVVALFSDSR